VDTPPILNPATVAPKTKRRGRRKWVYIVIAAIIVLLGAPLFWALHKSDPVVPVQTEKIQRRTITESVVANGKIYPVLEVHISPEVSGEITEMRVKEGQSVHKGDLLLKIKPDHYVAALNQAKASYESAVASKTTATANLEKAEADFKRNDELFNRQLISESDFISYKVARNVSRAQWESAGHQVAVAKAAVDSAEESLSKTTILSPLDGTITTLNSQAGERVLGTVQNAGTDIMIISDLTAMEARVDIGEMDIVLLQPGERATLEVDSFKDKKFTGVVTDVANSSSGMKSRSALAAASSTANQAATQFQVRIRLNEHEAFRPGMSVTAKVETRIHTNTIAAPIASVTTRVVKKGESGKDAKAAGSPTNPVASTLQTNATNAVSGEKMADRSKPVEVVFVVRNDTVTVVPVTIGISDDNFWEITDGLKEGDEIVTGNYRAVSRDLEDGKKIKKSTGADKKL
jgi:HlyD family secretion protein